MQADSLDVFKRHNPEDPDVWTALAFDQSLPMDPEAKAAWLKETSRWTRQYLQPLCRPFLYLLLAVIQVYKVVFPNLGTSSKLLHKLIVRGLSRFVTPEGNYLFVRHFHLGTQVLQFLCRNIDGVQVTTNPLFPKKLSEFEDNLILKHDINLYNFIIDVNRELQSKKIEMKAKSPVDFSSLHRPDIKVADYPNSWTNFVDIHTAIDFILPLFQVLLTDRQFWRSTHSLQLDETIGLYFAKLFGLQNRLHLVNNRHPLSPVSTGEASFRLVLHCLSTEILHAMLIEMKEKSTVSHQNEIQCLD
jgi:hypothetical protein